MINTCLQSSQQLSAWLANTILLKVIHRSFQDSNMVGSCSHRMTEKQNKINSCNPLRALAFYVVVHFIDIVWIDLSSTSMILRNTLFFLFFHSYILVVFTLELCQLFDLLKKILLRAFSILHDIVVNENQVSRTN